MRNITLLLCLGLPLAAQSIPATLAGAGYRTPPSAIEAAPGQVLIVSLNGAQTRVPNPVFGTFDPVTGMSAAVAGFSAQWCNREAARRLASMASAKHRARHLLSPVCRRPILR
ncbi:MAG TPA: hypothetical protein VFB63_12470 [Bryobacteraceae bacterium]|nr:hypothetical protein [Bryobacteraceae bacterium]